MTDNQRMRLMAEHGKLWAQIKPLEEELRPLKRQLQCLTGIIVSGFNPRLLSLALSSDSGPMNVAILEETYEEK